MPPPRVPAKPRIKASYHHGDLREALLEEGTRWVRRRGHPTISVREVARQVGVSHTAAFHHFESREALLAAVAEAGFRAMTAALERAATRAGTPIEQLGSIGSEYVAHATKHGRMYRLMFSAEVSRRNAYPELRAAADAMFALLIASVRECQQAGLVREGAAEEHGLFAWSAVHGLASLALERQVLHPELAERSLSDLTAVLLTDVYTGIQRVAE
jgi:AcrR family transcriptional regulator